MKKITITTIDNSEKSCVNITIPNLTDKKIVNANLKAKIASTTTSSYQVNFFLKEDTQWENVDLLQNISQYDLIAINISDELQTVLDCNLSNFKLNFVGGELELTDLKLEVEFISLTDYQESSCTQSIDVGKAGSGQVNLATGKLSMLVPLVSSDQMALPVSVNLNYNSNNNEQLKNIGLPKNWSTNFNQFLIKKQSEDGSLLFDYIDENGKTQVVEESYYYTKNGKKITVKRPQANESNNQDTNLGFAVDLDGNYVFRELESTEDGVSKIVEYPVSIKLTAPSGLQFTSSIADIKGANLVDFEPNELIETRSQIKQYQSAIEEIQTNLDSNKKQLSLLALSKKILSKQNAFQKSSVANNIKYNNLQRKIEVARGEYHKTHRNFNDGQPGDGAESYLSSNYFTDEMIDNIYNFYKSDTKIAINENKELTDHDTKILRDNLLEEASPILTLGFKYRDDNPTFGSWYMQNQSLKMSEELYNNQISKDDFLDYIKPELSSFDYTLTDDELAKIYASFKQGDEFTLSLKDMITIDLQIENLVYTCNKYVSSLDEYQGMLSKLKHQEKLYEQQVPAHYLYNDSIILGFGKTLDADDNETNIYRLILITDAYENTVYVEYESPSNSLIKSISGSSNGSILFEYDNNQLVSIQDARERKVTFKYSNECISAITHLDQTTSHYYYSNDNLSAVLNQNALGISLSYDSNKVTKIKAISGLDSVENGVVNYKNDFSFDVQNVDNFVVTDQTINIKYNNCNSTTVKNAQNKSVTYIFDEYGKVKTTYENTFDENVGQNFARTSEFNYESSKISLNIQPLPYSENYLKDVFFENCEMVENFSLTLNNFVCGESSYPSSYLSCNTNIHLTDDTKKASVMMSSAMLSNLQNNQSLCSHNAFVVCGWAKANSAFVLPVDLTEAEKQEQKQYLLDRKFELRVEITYLDNTKATFRKNFDWRNTDWQYCAVPVYVDHSKQIGSITCFVDYSNNTGSIRFTDLEFKTATWEKSSYNQDGLIIKKEAIHSEWLAEYEYDKSNLIKEIITSKKTNKQFVTTYDYTKTGKLLRTTDYNGIVKENVYNDKGIVIKTITYHKNEPTSKLYEESIVDDKGNTTSSVNAFGEKISENTFVPNTGIVATQTDNLGNKTSFGYDANDTLIEQSSCVDGINNATTFDYQLGFLTSLKHNNFAIQYDYDSLGNTKQIKIANNTYLTKQKTSEQEVVTLSSTEKYRKTFDNNGNVLDTYYTPKQNSNDSPSEVLIAQNLYDTCGNLVQTKDYTNGEDSSKLYIDSFGNNYKCEGTQNGAKVDLHNVYDENHSNIIQTSINIGQDSLSYSFDFNNSPQSKVQNIELCGKFDADSSSKKIFNQSLSYDKLQRLSQISTNTLSREYSYLKSGDHTSNLVSKLQFGVGGTNKDHLTYKYDQKGNITEVRRSNLLLARYAYDSLSRLVREDNADFGKTTVFKYDAGGNIICKLEYDFSLVDNIDVLTVKNSFDYTYPVQGWRDQLLNFNGAKFEYDSLGNPTIFKGKKLSWSHARQLDAFDVSTDSQTAKAKYKYNANGIRIAKEVDGFTTKYYLNGTKILAQKDSINHMTFFYGSDGVIGFHLKNNVVDEDFFYKKNVQNDIIGIYNSAGTQICEYSYDAWGNEICRYLSNLGTYVEIEENYVYNDISNINRFVAFKNPFRYRSYYFDFETGMYYLNSRYYDPQLGRFINADDISALDVTKVTINGLNLYAYCLNNPVNEVDESGYFLLWLFITSVIVGALVSAGTSVITQGITNGFGNINWLQVGWDALIGAISGAISVGGLGKIGMTIAGAVIGLVSSIGSNIINGSDFGSWKTWLNIGVSTTLGGAFGYLGGTGATNNEYITNKINSTLKTPNLTLNSSINWVFHSDTKAFWKSYFAWNNYVGGLPLSMFQSLADISRSFLSKVLFK